MLYVYPEGSRAASAGVFLAMAADIAAMAPQTNIGSSTPISATGEEIPADLRRKVVNDAAAFIGELAREHGRNAEWAESAVRVASNLGATEALEQNVVDFVAPDLPTLLNEIDGMKTKPKGIVMNTAGAEVDTIEMGLWKQILDLLVDPNLIVLLMSIGLLGITIEILNPGLILPGTVGAISLILGLFGLQVLPISWAGPAPHAARARVLRRRGVRPEPRRARARRARVSFVLGALLLFDPAGDAYEVSIWVALAIALTLALVIGVAMAKVSRCAARRPQTGEEELVGDSRRRAPARSTRTGTVFVHGELWRARTRGRPDRPGRRGARRPDRRTGLELSRRRARRGRRARRRR